MVLAVGLSELIGGWGKLARSGLPVRWSALWVGWSLAVVVWTMMYWSGIWPYREASFREGYRVAWLAVPTLFLVVLSYLLTPEPEPDAREIDLEARYWRNAPRLFPIFAAFMVSTFLADAVILGRPVATAGFEFLPTGTVGSIGLGSILLAGLTRRPWVHWLALVFVLALGLLYLVQGPDTFE